MNKDKSDVMNNLISNFLDIFSDSIPNYINENKENDSKIVKNLIENIFNKFENIIYNFFLKDLKYNN